MDDWYNQVPTLGTTFMVGFILWCVVGFIFSIHLADDKFLSAPIKYVIRQMSWDLDWAYK